MNFFFCHLVLFHIVQLITQFKGMSYLKQYILISFIITYLISQKVKPLISFVYEIMTINCIFGTVV